MFHRQNQQKSITLPIAITTIYGRWVGVERKDNFTTNISAVWLTSMVNSTTNVANIYGDSSIIAEYTYVLTIGK